jgi:hypothetical protein
MSLWLTEANRWAGAGRSFWLAEMQRQQTTMFNDMMQQSLRFWSGAWLAGLDRPKVESRRSGR